MKNILLATTFLAASAGVASADISFSGSAKAGLASDAGGAFETYSSANLAVSMTGSTDNGLTFGADFDTTLGRSYTFGDSDTFADESGAFGMPTIWIDGAFGKVEISDDNFDFFDDANAGGDTKYTGAFGAVSVGLIADVDLGEFSGNLGYAANNISVNLNADTYSLWDISLGYTLGAITATVATDESSLSSLKLAYDNNGMSASVKFDTDSFWEADAGYSANSITVNLGTDADSHWDVTASYDLGGGLSLEAGTNYTSDAYLGAAMEF